MVFVAVGWWKHRTEKGLSDFRQKMTLYAQTISANIEVITLFVSELSGHLNHSRRNNQPHQPFLVTWLLMTSNKLNVVRTIL